MSVDHDVTWLLQTFGSSLRGKPVKSMYLSKPPVVHTYPNPLLVEIEPNDGGIKVVVVGELDLGSAPQLLAAIVEYEASVDDPSSLDDYRGLITYDLAGVTFLDAAGVRALLTPGIGRVGIVNPSRCVEHVLDLLELDMVIPGSGLSNQSTVQAGNVSEPESVTEEAVGDWAVITLEGEIDLAKKDELDAILIQQWNPTQDLLIDFCPVTFIDSTGLHWLLKTQRTVLDAGRELRLIIPEGGNLDRLLDTTGLTSSFVIYRNLDKTLDRISSGRIWRPDV